MGLWGWGVPSIRAREFLLPPPGPLPSQSWLAGCPISSVLCGLLVSTLMKCPLLVAALPQDSEEGDQALGSSPALSWGHTGLPSPEASRTQHLLAVQWGSPTGLPREPAPPPALPCPSRSTTTAGPVLGTPSLPPLETWPCPHSVSPPLHPTPSLPEIPSLPCPVSSQMASSMGRPVLPALAWPLWPAQGHPEG